MLHKNMKTSSEGFVCVAKTWSYVHPKNFQKHITVALGDIFLSCSLNEIKWTFQVTLSRFYKSCCSKFSVSATNKLATVLRDVDICLLMGLQSGLILVSSPQWVQLCRSGRGGKGRALLRPEEGPVPWPRRPTGGSDRDGNASDV